ncbi:helix-turn-helix transcriptional regulator [Kitasatospora sp. NA04385]|uniref:helix-turn-helix transcriptional regulator n=1 Tax=Kitasatospora sp. NA04385 TaxID=2742135 RepID=UPI0015902CE5|nr:helix-turn-helix transcriptional regulator [Kitasatospora sp. NA04385]QKW22274.1 helix-turn-helix transcriptional regulator [Kitasatospora sp. NA04385]
MGDNTDLRDLMKERGLNRPGLASLVNKELAKMGCPGTVSVRTIANWLSGKTQWPQGRIQVALFRALGRTPEQLGFIPPPGAVACHAPPEEPVHRRNFLVASATLPLAASTPSRTVGHSDVDRLRASLDTLTALDDHRGGHGSLESASLAGAEQALELQRNAVGESVQKRLYGLAAEYTATAAFSSIDSRQFDRAEQLLDRTLRLAGLGRDHATMFRAYNLLAMIGYHRNSPSGSLVAAQAAQATQATRRDPFLASLGHARTAIALSAAGDRQAALRSLGYANESLHRADERPRPGWTTFYGSAELEALSAVVHQQLGDSPGSERSSHRAIAGIPPQFRRNRSLATARLALAQLGQNDLDQACKTASQVYTLMGTDPLPPRLRSLLGDFHRGLITLAPDAAVTQEWTDRVRAQGDTQ